MAIAAPEVDVIEFERGKPPAKPIDPITARVIAGALDSIALEVGHKLTRMSYSSIIRESEDFGVALLDAKGRQICECSLSTPLQLGPVKCYERGKKNEAGWRMLRDNIRASDMVVGDMEAQVAACQIGAQRYAELLDQYGRDTVEAATEELMNYSERMMRQQIEAL